jgi:hypothetical protein
MARRGLRRMRQWLDWVWRGVKAMLLEHQAVRLPAMWQAMR